jgi:hypothetical protein
MMIFPWERGGVDEMLGWWGERMRSSFSMGRWDELAGLQTWERTTTPAFLSLREIETNSDIIVRIPYIPARHLAP